MAQVSNTLETIQHIWQDIYPDQAFDYYFLDDRFKAIYSKERILQRVFTTFTAISVIVTFLGVFGLSLFISLGRRKEFGIRKVLGASPAQILLLFSGDFLKRAMLSIMIGAPMAYYLLNIWLSNFRYRIDFNIWMLIIPGILLILLILIAFSFESNKMAKLNPVDIIKEG